MGGEISKGQGRRVDHSTAMSLKARIKKGGYSSLSKNEQYY